MAGAAKRRMRLLKIVLDEEAVAKVYLETASIS